MMLTSSDNPLRIERTSCVIDTDTKRTHAKDLGLENIMGINNAIYRENG